LGSPKRDREVIERAAEPRTGGDTTVSNERPVTSISGRRLEILSKQEELATRKIRIAEERFADERINKLTMLEADVARLEARVRVLEELMTYLVNRTDPESRFKE
jgi:hypothetical protein